MEYLVKLPTGWGDPTTWVLVALVVFLGLLAYLGVPKMMMQALDARSKAIADELDEARRLREEAQEVLAGFQRRQRAAEQEAQDIVERARRDADAMATAMRQELTERLERRAVLAERKIAQAEADAAARVRHEAAELATAAAAQLLRGGLSPAANDQLIRESLSELSTRINAR